jgi:hypothetical protein
MVSDMAAFPIVRYRVNADDVIVSVGGAWDEFATENDAPSLLAQQVVGRHLRAFITGDTTRMFISAMLEGVRARQTSLVRPYRCDSASARRHMEMTLEPQPEGCVELTHRIVRLEPLRRHVSIAAAPGSSTSRLTVRCSICNRLSREGRWVEPDEDPRPAQAGTALRVAYGICPECQRAMSLAS